MSVGLMGRLGLFCRCICNRLYFTQDLIGHFYNGSRANKFRATVIVCISISIYTVESANQVTEGLLLWVAQSDRYLPPFPKYRIN